MTDAALIREAAGGPIDCAIVLGSGLSAALRDVFPAKAIPYASLPGMPDAQLRGHAGAALAGTWHGKRVCAFAGRSHLYQGFTAHDVTANVRFAHAAGARVIVLTNAAGALNPEYAPGDFMLLSDHINLTGSNPLTGLGVDDPFVDMNDCYAPRLRALLKAAATPEHRLREGVYAGLLGPSYETAAEARYLRTIGADAAGMSTVLETILARHLAMEVAGISLITNVVAAAGTSHAEVTDTAAQRAAAFAALLDGFIAAL